MKMSPRLTNMSNNVHANECYIILFTVDLV